MVFVVEGAVEEGRKEGRSSERSRSTSLFYGFVLRVLFDDFLLRCSTPKLTVDSGTDFRQRFPLHRHTARQHGLTHADVAIGRVRGLVAGEQRAVAGVLRAIAMAVDPIERGSDGARGRVRLERTGVAGGCGIGEGLRGRGER